MTERRQAGLALAPLVLLELGAFVWPLAVLARHGEVARLALPVTDPVVRGCVLTSYGLSLAVAVVAVGLAIPAGWALARSRAPAARLVLSLPLLFSGVMVGFLGVLVLGNVGALPALSQRLTGTRWGEGLAYTPAGLFLAYLWFELPRAVLALEAAFRELDPDLEAAAASLGAGPWARFRRVVLPGVWPAIRETVAAAFAIALGSYGAALILTRRTTVLPVAIYEQFTGFLDDATACALCAWLVVPALVAGALSGGLLPRARKAE